MAANQMWNSHGDDEERLRLLDFINPDSEVLKPMLAAAIQHAAHIVKAISSWSDGVYYKNRPAFGDLARRK